MRTGPELAEPRSVPESAQRERHNGDEFQKSIILTPTTTRAGNVLGPTQPRADTRTEGGLRSPAMSYSRHTPSKHPCKSCCVCQLRPHGRQRRLQRKMSTIQVQSVIAALQLPNVCHARATTGCPTRCRCRCQPRSESSAHAAAAGPVGRDANLCHAVCKGGQHRSIMVVVPTAARSAA